MEMHFLRTMILFLCIGTVIISLNYCKGKLVEQDVFIKPLHKVADIAQLFKLNPREIGQKSDAYMQQAKKVIDTIIAIPNEQRTYENTAQQLDKVVALSQLAVHQHVCEAKG